MNTQSLRAICLPLSFHVLSFVALGSYLCSGSALGAPIAGKHSAASIAEISQESTFPTTAWMIVAGVAGGGLITAILVALLWRRKAEIRELNGEASERVKDAGVGVPAVTTMQSWTHSRLCSVIARLVESDGYKVEYCGDVLCLSRHGLTRPCVVVSCAAHCETVVSKQALEEFSAIMPDVAMRWIVSPSGFSAQARKYASANKELILIDGQKFASMLRDVPPFLVGNVIQKEANQFAAA